MQATKLILAIVCDDDANAVSKALTGAGFFVTKLATTGGFLMSGNTTMLIGTSEDLVDSAIQIISENCRKRKGFVPASGGSLEMGVFTANPVEISMGGATIFVVDVEKFIKL